MQAWYKGTKMEGWPIKIIFLISLLFLLFPCIAFALENCGGTINVEDVPCLILLPFNQSNLNCANYNVKVYNISTILYTQTLSNYTPNVMCNATFNQSGTGTYTFLFSTGDTADIVVTSGYARFYIYICLFVVLFLLLILGYWLNQEILLYLVGFLSPVMAIDIYFNGFPNVSNVFLTNGVVMILAGIGFYYLILPFLSKIGEMFS